MPLLFERPSTRYMRELREVARDATILTEVISGANFLPDRFPKESVALLCSSLVALPGGTAEGSIAPLAHAQSRLPSWRNEYLDFAEEIEALTNGSEIPTLRRGERLDQSIKSLYAAVGSAIECYKQESGNEVPIDIEPEGDLPDGVELGRDAAISALSAMGEVARSAGKLTKQRGETQHQYEKPQRILTDVEIQSQLGQAELMLQNPRPNLLERLKKAGDKTIVAIAELEGPSLVVGTGVVGFGLISGQPLLATVGTFIVGAGKSLAYVAAKIRKIQIATSVENGTEPIQKPLHFDLNQAHLMILRGEAPPVSWRHLITDLSFKNVAMLSDLTPLVDLTALESLDLAGTSVTSIKPLKKLKLLRLLRLTDAPIEDILALNHLTGLEYLDLEGTNARGLGGFEKLKKLSELSLIGTKVRKLTPLRQLKSLKLLNLGDTEVDDVSSLDELVDLGLAIVGFQLRDATKSRRRRRGRRGGRKISPP